MSEEYKGKVGIGGATYEDLTPMAKKIVDRDRATLAEIKRLEKEDPKRAAFLRNRFRPSCITLMLDYFIPPEEDEENEDRTPEDIYNN